MKEDESKLRQQRRGKERRKGRGEGRGGGEERRRNWRGADTREGEEQQLHGGRGVDAHTSMRSHTVRVAHMCAKHTCATIREWMIFMGRGMGFRHTYAPVPASTAAHRPTASANGWRSEICA